jgi:hypothetical protein
MSYASSEDGRGFAAHVVMPCCLWRVAQGLCALPVAGPEGPWSPPRKLFPNYTLDSDTNIAPLILPNGSLVAIWRKWLDKGSRPFVATAADWRDVASYKMASTQLFPDLGMAGTEDPFLYTDQNGHFHAIFHHMYGAGTSDEWWMDTNGGHAFSRDGLSWTYSGVAWGNPEQPRGYIAHFTDGGTYNFTRLERPHFIFDATGQPTHLVSAAQYMPGVRTGPGDAHNDDASYTMVQAIRPSRPHRVDRAGGV